VYRLTGDEHRQLVIDHDRMAQEDRQRVEEAVKPSPETQHSARMLVDGFGSQTRDPGPTMRGLHEAFTEVRRTGGRVRTALERVPDVRSIVARGMNRSMGGFALTRDWDKSEKKG
jgi:hypothetical protein